MRGWKQSRNNRTSHLPKLNRRDSPSGNDVLVEFRMVTSFGRAGFAAVLGGLLLLTAGCSRTQTYLATGAAIGVGGGALVAAASGGSVVGGAIVGGALGTGGGYIASRY
jgi:hypothetical protein